MSEKRTVTVSITINLGNYENLRLEVSDIAETKEEADELRRFLADVLDGYANNNATAKETIDKYKDRILADAGAEEEEPAFGFFAAEEEPVLPFAPVIEDVPESEPEPEVMPFSVPEAPAEEPVAVPKAEPAAAAEFTCSKCGAPVTKLQRDVSMLFNHKILCKDCMK